MTDLLFGRKKKKDQPRPDPKPDVLLYNSGVIFLDKEFNQENIMPIVKLILEYNMMPEGQRPEVINLIINSPGGSVFSATHLIDAMKTSEIPVATTAQGLAASCGILTLMAGTPGLRRATHMSSLMSHQYAWGSQGKEHELYGRLKEFELSSERMIDHYKKCTGKSRKYIRKNLLGPTDVWMTPDEAVEHGIIDEVITTY